MKRYGLGAQYVSFWRAKRKVLNCETIPFAKQWSCGDKIVKFIACYDSAKSGVAVRVTCSLRIKFYACEMRRNTLSMVRI